MMRGFPVRRAVLVLAEDPDADLEVDILGGDPQ
jgi:hypothetical protein